MDATSPAVEFAGVSVRRGPVTVLADISFSVPQRSIVALLGSNGVGKSTCLRTISGFHKPFAGELRVFGTSVGGAAPHRVVRLGVAHVPEGRQIFTEMTIEENLLIGGHTRRSESAATAEEVLDRFPVLRDKRRGRGGELSGGQQQMLAIGRALMTRPRLLMLDEPSLGLAPKIVAEIAQLIETIRDSGVTIVLVEQNATFALDLCDAGVLLSHGRVVSAGPADVLREEGIVRAVYLGSDH